jgi:exonuclease-1
MGISGLLKELKSISKPIDLNSLSGKRIAIDGHCWLHRLSYGCARSIALKDDSNLNYVNHFMDMIQELIDCGISKILVVFDGRSLPAKSRVMQERKQLRQKNLEMALKADTEGAFDLAETYFRQTVSITPIMVQRVIQSLKLKGIAYIVSPYESDAQLTFFSKNNTVDYVISEDSDLIVYGCRRIIYKWNRQGKGIEIARSDLGKNSGLSFLNWTNSQFVLFCCLAGCDYAKNIPNIGIRKAYKFVSKFKTLPAVATEIRRIFNDGKQTMSTDIEEYLIDLQKAVATFHYQVIFNPFSLQLEYLNPIPSKQEIFMLGGSASRLNGYDSSLDFLGPLFDNSLAVLLAKGDIDPSTMEPYDYSLNMDDMNKTCQKNIINPASDDLISVNEGSCQDDILWHNSILYQDQKEERNIWKLDICDQLKSSSSQPDHHLSSKQTKLKRSDPTYLVHLNFHSRYVNDSFQVMRRYTHSYPNSLNLPSSEINLRDSETKITTKTKFIDDNDGDNSGFSESGIVISAPFARRDITNDWASHQLMYSSEGFEIAIENSDDQDWRAKGEEGEEDHLYMNENVDTTYNAPLWPDHIMSQSFLSKSFRTPNDIFNQLDSSVSSGSKDVLWPL